MSRSPIPARIFAAASIAFALVLAAAPAAFADEAPVDEQVAVEEAAASQEGEFDEGTAPMGTASQESELDENVVLEELAASGEDDAAAATAAEDAVEDLPSGLEPLANELQPIDDGLYLIESCAKGGAVLGCSNTELSKDAAVEVQHVNGTAAQLWAIAFLTDGDYSGYTIRDSYGRSLTYDSRSASVSLTSGSGSKWRIIENGDGFIIQPASGWAGPFKYLSVPGSTSITDGTRLTMVGDGATDPMQAKPYSFTARERFRFHPQAAAAELVALWPFKDCDGATPHYDDILWLAAQKISTGFPDGTFKPYASVARCDMAAFLYRLAGSPDYTPTAKDKAYFSDVNDRTPHAREIWWLASTGISRGWDEKSGAHTFRPYQVVARCDMAAFLYRLAGSPVYTPSAAEKAYFSDINANSPHANEVWWLASVGVSAGWTERNGSHTFKPFLKVARCDMAAFLHRMGDKSLVADPSTLKYEPPSSNSASGSASNSGTNPGGSTTVTPSTNMVRITSSGTKYHRPEGCRSVSSSQGREVSLDYALSHGYTPCKNCYH